MRRAIINALIRFARRLGKWILEHFIRNGKRNLIGYVTGKIDDFKRKGWHRRARRWQRFLDWLKPAKCTNAIVREVDNIVGDIPMVAAAEREAA